jgi:hypothetical protein
MPHLTQCDMSCGVYMLEELDGRSDYLLKRIMAGYKLQARNNARKEGFAQVIWSDADYRENGERLAKYVEKRFGNILHLGRKVVRVKAERSPTSGNNITTYIWTIPHAAFLKDPFYKEVDAKEHEAPWRGQTGRRHARHYPQPHTRFNF